MYCNLFFQRSSFYSWVGTY